MKAVCIAAMVVLASAFPSTALAATVHLDAFAYATYNAADFGPPTVPLVTDAAGNVLNPTIGQVYAIQVTLSVTDLGTLPNGNTEKGLASIQFDMTLDGLSENATAPGWYLDPQTVDLNGTIPGGCCVPLWLDLCDCGSGGSLADISVGVDVADFVIGNTIFDLRQSVGQRDVLQTFPTPVGTVYMDYLGGEAQVDVAVTSFQVHDFETVYHGAGLASGDIVRFVPEPSSADILLLGLFVALVTGLARVTAQSHSLRRSVMSMTRGNSLRSSTLEACEDRRLMAISLELAGSQQLTALSPINVSEFQVGSGPR